MEELRRSAGGGEGKTGSGFDEDVLAVSSLSSEVRSCDSGLMLFVTVPLTTPALTPRVSMVGSGVMPCPEGRFGVKVARRRGASGGLDKSDKTNLEHIREGRTIDAGTLNDLTVRSLSNIVQRNKI